MVQPALPPRREALHDTIQDRIERYIIQSGRKPGDALPSQQELARALGISMPSLREAMKSLEALGVVEARQGSGTFVGRFSFDAFVDGLAFRIRLEANEHRRTVTEFLDIRMILERTYVQQVAIITNDEHIAELYALVDLMDQAAADDRPFRDEDRLFHVLLYKPVANTMLEMLVAAFWQLSAVARNEFNANPVVPASTVAEHRSIVDALAARDPDMAARAMTDHFDGILSRIKTY